MDYMKPPAFLAKGRAKIIEIISDNEGIIKAQMYVSTICGEVIFFTFKEESDQMLIIGFDMEDGADGQYSGLLKQIAERYKKQGYSIREANKKAYDDGLEITIKARKEMTGE